MEENNMRRELLHIWGPFSINSYGLAILIGLLVLMWFMQQHPLRKKLLSKDQFIDTLLIGIFIGIAGGRLLYVLNEWDSIDSFIDVFKLWEGGFSVLGSILGILFFLPLYLKKLKIPVVPFFDLAALHAPLLQSIARIGCFFAGCCYGAATNVGWAIMYTDQKSLAPLYEYLHPTQLYSSALLLSIFLFMYFIAQKTCKKPGQLFTLYLILVSLERFIVDFLRDDRIFFTGDTTHVLSTYQIIALLIAVSAGIMFTAISLRPSNNNYHESL